MVEGLERDAYLVVLRHRLPIVHEEDFERVRNRESHLRPSCAIVVIAPPFRPAPALFASPCSASLCAPSRGGGFCCSGARGCGGGLRPGKVLLKGQVGLVEFEEARRGDPFVPSARRTRGEKKSEVGSRARAVSGDARLLPAFVVHKVMWPNGV